MGPRDLENNTIELARRDTLTKETVNLGEIILEDHISNLLDEIQESIYKKAFNFREEMTKAGFDIKPGGSPIVPIMLYDAALSQEFANRLLTEGVYAIGFFYPVVAKGQARIRTQISAAHTQADLDKAIAAFIKVGKDLGVIK